MSQHSTRRLLTVWKNKDLSCCVAGKSCRLVTTWEVSKWWSYFGFYPFKESCVNVIRSVCCPHEPQLFVTVFKSCYWYSLCVWPYVRSRQISTVSNSPWQSECTIHSSSMNLLWPVSFSFCLFPWRLFLYRPFVLQTDREIHQILPSLL